MQTPPFPPKSELEQALNPQEDTLAGKELGNYRLLERIGMGATALVYRAEHTKLGRIYAVKILHPSISIRPGMRERFLREAKTAGQLNHENIIFIADFAIDPELGPYMVMEYLQGENLQDVLKRDTTIPKPRLKDIASQVCNALAVAHNAGIIHRDLKPENIFLVPRPEGGETVKILDFGIARLVQSTASLTGEGKLLGTPLYMSPEQCRGNAELTPASDIYSFGIVLFEMLTGRTPFEGDNPQKLLIDHFLVDPPELPTHHPESLRQLQAELLAKSPDERPAHISIVQQRLLETLEDKQQPILLQAFGEASHTHEQLPALNEEMASEYLSELDIIQDDPSIDMRVPTTKAPAFSISPPPGHNSGREEYSTQEQLPAATGGHFTPPPPSHMPVTPRPNPRYTPSWNQTPNKNNIEISLTDPRRMTLQENAISTDDVLRVARQQQQPTQQHVVVKQRGKEQVPASDHLLNDLEHLFVQNGQINTPAEQSLSHVDEIPLNDQDEELLKDLNEDLPSGPSKWEQHITEDEPIIELHKKKEVTQPSPPAPPITPQKERTNPSTGQHSTNGIRVEKGSKQHKSSPPIATSRDNRPAPSANLNATEIDLSLGDAYAIEAQNGQNLDFDDILQPSFTSNPQPSAYQTNEAPKDSSNALQATIQEGSQPDLSSLNLAQLAQQHSYPSHTTQADDKEPSSVVGIVLLFVLLAAAVIGAMLFFFKMQ